MNDITRETKGQAERQNSEWQAQTLTQGGHEIASLLNWNEQNFFIFTYDETNKDKLGKLNKRPNKRQPP